MEPQQLGFVIFTIVFAMIVFGGFALIAYTFVSRQRMRELAVRERIAMIERGLLPAPEADPAQFDRVLHDVRRPASSGRAQRYRSGGVIVMGLGFSLLVLLTFAGGEPEVGFGVGGGLAALGAALFFNGLLLTRDADPIGDIPIRSTRSGPPPNVGP